MLVMAAFTNIGAAYISHLYSTTTFPGNPNMPSSKMFLRRHAGNAGRPQDR
jgi:hypothetical protein